MKLNKTNVTTLALMFSAFLSVFTINYADKLPWYMAATMSGLIAACAILYRGITEDENKKGPEA